MLFHTGARVPCCIKEKNFKTKQGEATQPYSHRTLCQLISCVRQRDLSELFSSVSFYLAFYLVHFSEAAVLQHASGGQSTTLWSCSFLPLVHGSLGLNSGHWACMANTFTFWASSSFPIFIIFWFYFSLIWCNYRRLTNQMCIDFEVCMHVNILCADIFDCRPGCNYKDMWI